MRALDHLVLASRDLPRMAERFAASGFQVGARNRHPWGTENHIVQFGSTFLELLGLAADYRSVPKDQPAFPFASFIERYLDENESGIAMAVLRSDDAAADADLFVRRGIGSGRILPFSRSARAPDGGDRTVAFTVAFAEAPGMPSAGFFTCQHHRPENFWNTAFQQHANTATEITGFTLVADDVDRAASFLTTFADEPSHADNVGGREIPLAGGSLCVVDRSRWRGPTLGAPAGPYIAAMQLRVRDVPAFHASVVESGWTSVSNPDGVGVLCSPLDAPTFGLIIRDQTPD